MIIIQGQLRIAIATKLKYFDDKFFMPGQKASKSALS